MPAFAFSQDRDAFLPPGHRLWRFYGDLVAVARKPSCPPSAVLARFGLHATVGDGRVFQREPERGHAEWRGDEGVGDRFGAAAQEGDIFRILEPGKADEAGVFIAWNLGAKDNFAGLLARNSVSAVVPGTTRLMVTGGHLSWTDLAAGTVSSSLGTWLSKTQRAASPSILNSTASAGKGNLAQGARSQGDTETGRHSAAWSEGMVATDNLPDLEMPASGGGGGGGGGAEKLAGQLVLPGTQTPTIRVVQQPTPPGKPAASMAGSAAPPNLNTNAVVPPCELTSILPPCARAIWSTIYSPKPRPSLPERDAARQ